MMRSYSNAKSHPRAGPPPKSCQKRDWFLGAYKQLSRYSIVSALALSVDILIYTDLVHSGTRATLAAIVGYTIGMVLHYALSCRYVFDTTLVGKSEGRLFSEFVISGLTGLALTAIVIWFLTEILHQSAGAAKFTAVGVSFFAVFILRRSVIFAPRAV
jgi:putative flippase GtrA